MYNKFHRRKSGQALMEYLVVTGMLLAVVVMLALFLYVFKQYGGRVLELMASEFP
jgi:hypothetical protein